MPLYVDAHLIVTKIKDESYPKSHRKENYTDEEIEKIRLDLLQFNTADLLGDLEVAEYTFSIHDISFIKPTKSLKGIEVPLPELRQAIAKVMAEGNSVLNLEDLLYLIRTVYREKED